MYTQTYFPPIPGEFSTRLSGAPHLYANLNVLRGSEYSYYTSRDRGIFAAIFTIIALLIVIISALCGAGIISTPLGVLLTLAIGGAVSIGGILLRFASNTTKKLSVLPSRTCLLPKPEARFLRRLSLVAHMPQQEVDTSINQKRFCLPIKNIQMFPMQDDQIQQRIAELGNNLENLIQRALCIFFGPGQSLLDKLCLELKSLFIPSWGSKKVPETMQLLREISQLLIKHPCIDFLQFIIQNKAAFNKLVASLLEMSKDERFQSNVMDLVIPSLKMLNIWFYGWFSQANNLEAVNAWDETIVSAEAKQSLCEGNFYKFIVMQASPDQQDALMQLIPCPVDALAASNMDMGLNTPDYLNSEDSLNTCINGLNELLFFCLDLPDPSSRWFLVSLSSHYQQCLDLFEYIQTNKNLLMANPFAIIRLFYNNLKYQTFVRNILIKIMPISSWEAILSPLCAGAFASGLITFPELQKLSMQLNMSSPTTVIRAAERGEALELFFPKLFEKDPK